MVCLCLNCKSASKFHTPYVFQVDLALWGHVHNYERTCAVYQGRCFLLPFRDEENGADIYKSNSYRAPVHVIVGMGGFELDKFAESVSSISSLVCCFSQLCSKHVAAHINSYILQHQNWSLSRICNYGYAKINATPYQLQFQVKEMFHLPLICRMTGWTVICEDILTCFCYCVSLTVDNH